MIQTTVLLKNMVDQILEAQLKLGFASETIRLYYPLGSLNHMLGTKEEDPEKLCRILKEALQKENQLIPEKGILVSHRGKRFEISIPPETTTYIHEKIPAPAFLRDLIRLFSEDHHCSMEKIEDLFASYSSSYEVVTMPEGSEFDYAIHFLDETIDNYYYCIKMEMGHTIYHRFLEDDYRELL